jgi:hypothetical protein
MARELGYFLLCQREPLTVYPKVRKLGMPVALGGYRIFGCDLMDHPNRERQLGDEVALASLEVGGTTNLVGSVAG